MIKLIKMIICKFRREEDLSNFSKLLIIKKKMEEL